MVRHLPLKDTHEHEHPLSAYTTNCETDEQAKAARANEILAAGDVGLSIQVLQEFYVQPARWAARSCCRRI